MVNISFWTICGKDIFSNFRISTQLRDHKIFLTSLFRRLSDFSFYLSLGVTLFRRKVKSKNFGILKVRVNYFNLSQVILSEVRLGKVWLCSVRVKANLNKEFRKKRNRRKFSAFSFFSITYLAPLIQSEIEKNQSK